MLAETEYDVFPCAAGMPPPIGAVQGRRQGSERPTGRMKPDIADTAEFSSPTVWLLAVRDRRDRVAFGHLFDYFAPRLRVMMLRSGMGRAVADDMVQEVMLTAWQKAGQFDPARGQAAAWIYRIARNRQIDHIRRERRPMPDPVAMGVEDRADDAQHSLALDQEAVHLRDALGKLSDEQRAVIEHSFLGDLTHAEICQKTGLPMGTIKSRIRLGLERLRHELKELR